MICSRFEPELCYNDVHTEMRRLLYLTSMDKSSIYVEVLFMLLLMVECFEVNININQTRY